MQLAIDARIGLLLVLSVAVAIGTTVGLRMARGKEWMSPVRPWHVVLAYLWTVGVLGAYPSFAADHTNMPFLRLPLIMMVVTYLVALVTSALLYGIISAGRRATEAYSRRMARY